MYNLQRRGKGKKVLVLILVLILCSSFSGGVTCAWSNGGFSSEPSNPRYGTHDWVAHHALDWLPNYSKKYILDNLMIYLYGTELPDNGKVQDGIGDTGKHHIYFYSNRTLEDDSAGIRASSEYMAALNYLRRGDLKNAAMHAGIMAHYISDVAVFGHVMGSETDWGNEVHHSEYEEYINTRTSNYNSDFNQYLTFDGKLDNISAYNVTVTLAYNTTFDGKAGLNGIWMDRNYNWNDPLFKNRSGESLNLAVNYIADVLYTLYLEGASQSTTSPWPTTPDKTTGSTTPISNVGLSDLIIKAVGIFSILAITAVAVSGYLHRRTH